MFEPPVGLAIASRNRRLWYWGRHGTGVGARFRQEPGRFRPLPPGWYFVAQALPCGGGKPRRPRL